MTERVSYTTLCTVGWSLISRRACLVTLPQPLSSRTARNRFSPHLYPLLPQRYAESITLIYLPFVLFLRGSLKCLRRLHFSSRKTLLTVSLLHVKPAFRIISFSFSFPAVLIICMLKRFYTALYIYIYLHRPKRLLFLKRVIHQPYGFINHYIWLISNLDRDRST